MQFLRVYLIVGEHNFITTYVNNQEIAKVTSPVYMLNVSRIETDLCGIEGLQVYGRNFEPKNIIGSIGGKKDTIPGGIRRDAEMSIIVGEERGDWVLNLHDSEGRVAFHMMFRRGKGEIGMNDQVEEKWQVEETLSYKTQTNPFRVSLRMSDDFIRVSITNNEITHNIKHRITQGSYERWEIYGAVTVIDVIIKKISSPHFAHKDQFLSFDLFSDEIYGDMTER